MKYTISLVFAIYDDKIDFDEINENFKIKPTHITKKGDKILKDTFAKLDSWRYSVKINNMDNLTETLDLILDELATDSEYIVKMREKYKEVKFTIYISSDSAQIGFEIPQEILNKIATLNINFAVDIFSFGMAE